MNGQGVITSVELQKKQRHRYNIFVDEQFAFAVHEDILMKHRLFKGQVVSADRLEEVLRDEERQDAYVKTIRWLGARPRTEKEIRQYMGRKAYEPAVVDHCVERLKAERYVDDERFSRALTEERLQRQGKGKQWIRQELLQKGVDKQTVMDAVQSVSPEEEKAAAAALAKKRWRALSSGEDPQAARRKLYAYLARRGFSASAVREAVREAADGADDDDGEAAWDDDGGWE
ncbi:RecX family transcriptional regulator [Paenibacillus sp.]|uniref:RecX family transcriptional regulator n=1 Tax=Paenibacillus sp. TaxID=58172 RepID=UPI002D6193EF|nr:RecX family transcriptional regulator [Paenibacillus sp.]HZG57354.1 RecX family transcriptional regulator [Paenibacillus sp.]